MEYRIELMINKSRGEIWQAFSDSQKMKAWQTSLINIELIRGIPGQPGAESRLTFEEHGREFSLVEKVIACQAPESIQISYENQFSVNTIKNSFLEQGEDQTLWVTETEYQFKTLPMKIMGPVYKKNLAARTQRDMERFKQMVEKE